MNADRLAIAEVMSALKENDYAFTVSALGSTWDVYRFTRNGVAGMIAARDRNGRLEVGFFRAGDWSPEYVTRILNQATVN
jgi:hypothetical protein